VFLCSRTHSQLRQLLAELKSTPYRPKYTVLGSRQQFCDKREVVRAKGGADLACKLLVRVWSSACGDHSLPHTGPAARCELEQPRRHGVCSRERDDCKMMRCEEGCWPPARVCFAHAARCGCDRSARPRRAARIISRNSSR